jgi:hypothetical protein
LDHEVFCSLIIFALHDLFGLFLGRQQITCHQASGPKLVAVILVLVGPSVWRITANPKCYAQGVKDLQGMKQKTIFQPLS